VVRQCRSWCAACRRPSRAPTARRSRRVMVRITAQWYRFAVRTSGLTIARQAVHLGYPIQESLRSLLPLVDELIVNVGDGDDGTHEAVLGIGDPKIQVFRSTWDMAKRDGLTLSEETNKALARCRGEWAIYLQADEVLHEADCSVVRAALDRAHHTRVEAMSLLYYHFYGSYDTYKDDPRHWYRRATRIVRTGVGIESVGDACAFLVKQAGGWRQPRRRNLAAHVYHYGRAQPPAQMLRKQRNLERLYYDRPWLDLHGLPEDMDPHLVYADRRHLRVFTGTHPAVMRPRIAAVTLPVLQPDNPWPEWLRRAWVYGSWVVAWSLARLRVRR
jgi:hypothetical protein